MVVVIIKGKNMQYAETSSNNGYKMNQLTYKKMETGIEKQLFKKTEIKNGGISYV